MLRITIPAVKGTELWDEGSETFVKTPDLKEQTLQLEHSLVSISKWESKWCKPFISKTEKTDEETIDYIRCMTINSNVDPSVYDRLTRENLEEIRDYINAPMTATTVREINSGKNNNEVVTSELIYYWMISLQIPVEFQKWHLNRLITLIKVLNVKNSPPKKMSKREIMSRNAALNAARRKQLNSKG